MKSYYDADDSILINGNLNISPVNKKVAGKKIKKLYTNDTFQNDLGALVMVCNYLNFIMYFKIVNFNVMYSFS